jgi:DMSO/TMAO reductase YedYZ heme-binding membrane subunit
MAVRASARTSLLLFGASFVASSWWGLWRDSTGRWLLKNRRYLGLAFAASHTVHLAGILALIRLHHMEVSAVTLVVGGLGYLVIAAMAATSSDAAVKALGPGTWKRLHGFGARYLWLVFFLTLLPDGPPRVIETVMLLLVVALAGLRLTARRARERRPPPA